MKSAVFIIDDDLIISELSRRNILDMMQPRDGRDTTIYWDKTDLSIFTYSALPGDSGYTWMRLPDKAMFDIMLQNIMDTGKQMQFRFFGSIE